MTERRYSQAEVVQRVRVATAKLMHVLADEFRGEERDDATSLSCLALVAAEASIVSMVLLERMGRMPTEAEVLQMMGDPQWTGGPVRDVLTTIMPGVATRLGFAP